MTMEIVRVKLSDIARRNEPITACIGYFDGVHLGHQKLIQEVLRIAEETNTKPALITFEPDPWVVIKHVESIPHITPMKQRMKIGEKLGIQTWIILEFETSMASLSFEDFHKLILAPLHIHTLVCGFDFHYGNKGQGNVETLKQQSLFQIVSIDEVSSEHKKISSTSIEAFIREGDVERATYCMGRVYEIEGIVKKGNQVGRKHGFPTANLALSEQYVLPKKGVYIGSVHVDGTWYPAIINIGNNPTYNYQEQTSIEAHILGFERMIYDQCVQYRFYKYIRGEQKFANIDALSKQLYKDKEQAQQYFKGREEQLLCD